MFGVKVGDGIEMSEQRQKENLRGYRESIDVFQKKYDEAVAFLLSNDNINII